MEPVVYERSLRIPYYLGDRYHRMNLPHLMNVLVEISGEQTAAIGVRPVEELGLHWIIIQYQLKITRMPKTDEEITVRTFTKEHNRIFSYREFEVYDEEGHLLLEVLTVFALIDDNRKLSRIPKEIVDGYGSTENRRIRRMPKPELPENIEEAKRQDYNVRYFDIDSNFHANNSMYYIWMLDALGDEFLATHKPVAGNIVFEKEVHIGETVESYTDLLEGEDGEIISRHQIQVDDVIKCTGTFTWGENGFDYKK
jgi:medium-chain acyl-[acyl-carrier-protein] hydrolase